MELVPISAHKEDRARQRPSHKPCRYIRIFDREPHKTENCGQASDNTLHMHETYVNRYCTSWLLREDPVVALSGDGGKEHNAGAGSVRNDD
jgi:hypothetical protein